MFVIILVVVSLATAMTNSTRMYEGCGSEGNGGCDSVVWL